MHAHVIERKVRRLPWRAGRANVEAHVFRNLFSADRIDGKIHHQLLPLADNLLRRKSRLGNRHLLAFSCPIHTQRFKRQPNSACAGDRVSLKVITEVALTDEEEMVIYISIHVAHLRSEEHTSELQSLRHLVCRLLLEK